MSLKSSIEDCQFYVLGNVIDNLRFEYDQGTVANEGCGVTFMGEFWYFGGTNRRQVISK